MFAEKERNRQRREINNPATAPHIFALTTAMLQLKFRTTGA